MSYYGYFENCIKTARKKFEELLRTPRARGKQYEKEKQEIISQIYKSEEFGEIKHSEARILISELQAIHFDELAKARQEAKRKSIKRRKSE